MPMRDRALRLTTDIAGAAAGRAGAILGRFQRDTPPPEELSDAALEAKVSAQAEDEETPTRSKRFTRDG